MQKIGGGAKIALDAGEAAAPPVPPVPSAPANAVVAGVTAPAPAPAQQRLVVSGAVEISTDDVAGTTAAIRTEVPLRGGVIVADELRGAKYGVHAHLQVRLPPGAFEPFVAWLAKQGALESSNLAASDVSREYFDEELRLGTLRAELERLQKLLAERETTPIETVLAIERELTRVEGEIERLEGQHRYLADRVERATLDVHVSAHDQFVAGAPDEKFMLMVRGFSSSFLDVRDRHQSRLGMGVQLLFSRHFDFGLDVLPARGADARSMLFTAGTAVYSDFLGRGRRLVGNPYLGLRLGGGSVNGEGAFAYAADVGVEIVHHPRFLLDVTGRAMGLYYGKSPKSDVLFQLLLGVGVPF